MPPPKNEYRAWTRHLPGDQHTYTVSTDPSLIQLDALNAAFQSDMLYWAKPMSPEALKLCVEQSLCFGLYVNAGQGDDGENKKTSMIGLARLVTDYTTFGYLTDVYVLAAYQGKGLGKWVMQCLDEVLGSWPEMRRCVLFTKGEAAVRMYEETIGAREVGGTAAGLVLMERKGGGAVY